GGLGLLLGAFLGGWFPLGVGIRVYVVQGGFFFQGRGCGTWDGGGGLRDTRTKGFFGCWMGTGAVI
ncbi:hypothetical protein COCVIDRAFT_104034, partial [Bipolaris victoriae FI3]